MRRMVRVNTSISLVILGRAFSVPLCFSKMAWIEIARLNNRDAVPSAGVAEGKSQRERRVASKNRVGSRRKYFFSIRTPCQPTFIIMAFFLRQPNQLLKHQEFYIFGDFQGQL